MEQIMQLLAGGLGTDGRGRLYADDDGLRVAADVMLDSPGYEGRAADLRAIADAPLTDRMLAAAPVVSYPRGWPRPGRCRSFLHLPLTPRCHVLFGVPSSRSRGTLVEMFVTGRAPAPVRGAGDTSTSYHPEVLWHDWLDPHHQDAVLIGRQVALAKWHAAVALFPFGPLYLLAACNDMAAGPA